MGADDTRALKHLQTHISMVHPDWGWPKGPTAAQPANRAPREARPPTNSSKETIHREGSHHDEGYLERCHLEEPPIEPASIATKKNGTSVMKYEIIPCDKCMGCRPNTYTNWVTRKLGTNTLEEGHPEESQSQKATRLEDPEEEPHTRANKAMRKATKIAAQRKKRAAKAASRKQESIDQKSAHQATKIAEEAEELNAAETIQNCGELEKHPEEGYLENHPGEDHQEENHLRENIVEAQSKPNTAHDAPTACTIAITKEDPAPLLQAPARETPGGERPTPLPAQNHLGNRDQLVGLPNDVKRGKRYVDDIPLHDSALRSDEGNEAHEERHRVTPTEKAPTLYEAKIPHTDKDTSVEPVNDDNHIAKEYQSTTEAPPQRG